MKLKKIELENNPVLGDLIIDFTDENDEPIDTIILAGENGSGKTTILDIIYEFSNYRISNNIGEERRVFDIWFSEDDLELLELNENSKRHFQEISSPLVKISFDYSKKHWDQVAIKVEVNGKPQEIRGNALADEKIKKIFKSIYSSAEISFSPKEIRSVTAKKLDEEQNSSVKSSNNLSTEIAQLLIDVKSLDDSDFADWGKKNVGNKVDDVKLEQRIKRFKTAFNFMFPNLELKTIQNVSGNKKVTFEQFGKEVYLEDLSSGEKQIVFRGGFMLKDQQSNKGIVALLDEPEISLHPKWQLKILDFYKRLFKDENGKQTSQIFLATHSPFIIHNFTRNKDKVIILTKNSTGSIDVGKHGSYFGWKKNQIVQEAFRIDNFLEKNSGIPLVITEGKTDAEILRTAWEKLYPGEKQSFLIVPSGIEIDENKRSGNADQTRRTLELISNIADDRKIIGLFDNDGEGNIQYKGLNEKIFESYDVSETHRKHLRKEIYGLLLPVPDHRTIFVDNKDLKQRYLEIEHYFSDSILINENLKGDSILATEVFKIKGDKSNFAQKIKNFDPDGFSNFELIFSKLLSLLR